MFKRRLVDLGMEPFANTPAEFGKFIADDIEKWGKVIRAANIKGGCRFDGCGDVPYVPICDYRHGGTQKARHAPRDRGFTLH